MAERIMPVVDPKLGFIGAGMMASALINGIVAAKVCMCFVRVGNVTSFKRDGAHFYAAVDTLQIRCLLHIFYSLNDAGKPLQCLSAVGDVTAGSAGSW